MWLNGGIEKVSGMTETFIKERHHNITGKTEKVGIDDASLFLAEDDSWEQKYAPGTLKAKRLALYEAMSGFTPGLSRPSVGQ